MIIGTFPFVASFIKESSWPILLSLFNEVDTFQHYVIYAEMNTETYMYLAHWGFVIIFTVIAFFMYHRISESHSSCDKRLFKNIYIMWMYFCFLVPIFAINVDLLRIPRNFILPIYICIANCLEYKIKYSKIIFLMALVVLSLYFYKVSGGMEILDDILKYNYVFDIIDNY